MCNVSQYFGPYNIFVPGLMPPSDNTVKDTSLHKNTSHSFFVATLEKFALNLHQILLQHKSD